VRPILDDSPMRRRPVWGTWVRHGGALAATLLLNAAMVAFLLAWRSERGEAVPPVLAVPLRVIEPEPVDAELEEPEPAAETIEPEPEIEPPLPEPPLPETAPPDLPNEAPPPMELEAVPLAIDTPLFEAEAVMARPAEPPPVTPPPEPPKLKPRPTPPPPPKPRPAPSKPKPAPRRGLNRNPAVIEPPNLSAYYPRRARMRGVTGRTTIRIAVSAEGKPTDVQVLTSTPAGIFEHAATRVGRALQFRPALRDGRQVPASVRLPIVWRLE